MFCSVVIVASIRKGDKKPLKYYLSFIFKFNKQFYIQILIRNLVVIHEVYIIT